MKKLKNICEGFPSVQHARCLLLIWGSRTYYFEDHFDANYLAQRFFCQSFKHIGNVVSSKSDKSDVVYVFVYNDCHFNVLH